MTFFLGKHDYNRVKNGFTPDYIFSETLVRDGGTVSFVGLGYTVKVYHKIIDIKKLNDIGDKEYKYKKGTEVNFWLLPFLSREEIHYKTSRTILIKNKLEELTE